LYLHRLPCARPAIKKVWDHGAATRNVRERNAHRRWIKKSRPRWTARADAWCAKQVEGAPIKWRRRRCITIAEHHEVNLWGAQINSANAQNGWKRRIGSEPWTANSRNEGKCAAE
jgi:hypothetical protein